MPKKNNNTSSLVPPTIRYTLTVLALAGLCIMSYLTYTHITEKQSFCDLSAEVSCDVVTTSIYSELFGIPVSVIGIFYFGLVLVLSLVKKNIKTYQGLFLLTVFSILPSLYLTLTEILFIHSFCILCETSKVIMIIMMVLLYMAIRGKVKDLGRMSAPIIITGVVVAFVMFFAQTGTVVKEDHSGLVEHLNTAGWVYYKSYTCSNCRRQEKLLGDAYGLLNSIECHPDGPDGQPELCLEKKIDKTPTWLLEIDGQEVKRLEGLQLIDDLIEESGYNPDDE